MTGTRFLLHDDKNSLCADDEDDCIFVTTIFEGSETQIALTHADARDFGEWLIKRANEGGGESA